MIALKAIVGALVALGGSLGAAAASGHISLAGYITAVVAALVAFSAVYFAPNAAVKPSA